MRPEDLPAALVRRAGFVHASGISMAISPGARDAALFSFEESRKSGAKISFDANLRPKLWPLERARKDVAAALALTDYFFPSLEDAAALSGLEDPAAILGWAHRLGAKNVFLKLGAEGVIVSDGARKERIKGLEVPPRSRPRDSARWIRFLGPMK